MQAGAKYTAHWSKTSCNLPKSWLHPLTRHAKLAYTYVHSHAFDATLQMLPAFTLSSCKHPPELSRPLHKVPARPDTTLRIAPHTVGPAQGEGLIGRKITVNPSSLHPEVHIQGP